jgi:hypothetical protein
MIALDLDPHDVHRRGANQLWEMLKARGRQYSERNQAYARSLAYYFGRQKRGSSTLHEVLASSSTGRPLQRDLGVAFDVQRRYVSNRMAPIVEDYQAIVGRLPSMQVQPPTPDSPGEEKAERQTRYLYSTYQLVDMELHQAFSGFCLSCLGDALYTLEVDSDLNRVMPAAIMPIHAYPSFRRGSRRYELYDVLIAQVWGPDEIEQEFGFTPQSDGDDDCTVVTYLSPYQRSVLVGNAERFKMPQHVDWDLGFCPAIWVRNKINGALAGSDIAPVLALQDMYDFTLNVMADGLVEMTYPMRMIKGALSKPDGPMEYGPGANVEVGPDGDLKVVALAPPPQAGMMMQQTLIGDLNMGAGTTDVRQQGMPDRSNISGRAIQAAQGPQSTRIELKQILLGAALTRLNAYTMAMQERAPLVGHVKLDLQGTYQRHAFREEFIPNRDIDGWLVNTVTWDELVGVNRQQRIQMAVELASAHLADDLYAMQLAGIDNPVEMRKRIETSIQRQAKMQQELAGGQQQEGQPGSGMPPGALPGSPPPGGSQPPGLTGGGGGPPPPPQGPRQIARPPQLSGITPAGGAPTGPAEGGGQGQVSLRTVKIALEGAEGLRGEVFAVGQLATDQQAPKVQLVITDQRDYRAVRQAVLSLDPKPEIRYLKGKQPPPEASKVS